MAGTVGEIERLRQLRCRPDWIAAIGPLVAEKATQARRAQRMLGTFVDLWEGVVPGELATRTKVTGLRGGVAQVAVDSSSTAYELDRRLREGLEQQLRRAYGKTLVRVRISVGDVA